MDVGFTTPSVEIFDQILLGFLERIMVSIHALIRFKGRITFEPRDVAEVLAIIGAYDIEVKTFAPETQNGKPIVQIQPFEHEMITKAISKYTNAKRTGKYTSQSELAGLILPVGRITTLFRLRYPEIRVVKAAPVALAAILEVLASDLLVEASAYTLEDKRQRIQPRDILRAVRSDSELKWAFNCTLTDLIREHIARIAAPIVAEETKPKTSVKKAPVKKALQPAKPRSKASKVKPKASKAKPKASKSK